MFDVFAWANNFSRHKFIIFGYKHIAFVKIGTESSCFYLIQDSLETGEESVTNFPCTAAPPLYVPPSVDSVSSVIGEFGSPSQLRRSGSSVVRKANTSDDELDELNSPLTSILIDGSRSSPFPSSPSWISRGNNSQNAIRYELLRDIWMSCE